MAPTSTPSSPVERPRRSQAERTEETRRRLIDGAIQCLIDLGYPGTTTSAICQRGGVSHGSLLYHYGTRERLLAATLETIYERLQAPVLEALSQLPEGEERIDALVELMWSAFGAAEFKAVLELWLAAANQARVGGAIWPGAEAFDRAIQPLAVRLFPEAAARLPDFDLHVSLLFQALQGMGLVHAAWPHHDDDPTRSKVRALLARMLRDAFHPPATR